MKPVLLLLAVSALAFGQVPPMIPSAPDGGPVGGAGNLTTVGAVPYVSATGTLNQDPTVFFWDATNDRLGIGTATPATALDVAKSGASGTFRAYDQTATTGSTLAVFRAGIAQSGNVLEVQNNAGATTASISATGGTSISGSFVAAGNVIAGATQDVGWSARSTMTSPSNGVISLYNTAQTDFNRLQFGGTTSSFPSIQRSTTKLFFRLADDSAGATVKAGGYESSDGTAGVTVTTCTGFKNGLCISGT